MASVSHRGTGTPADGSELFPGSSINFLQDGDNAVERTVESKLRDTVAVNDFLPTGASDDWRTAIVNAMAHLADIGGGTLFFPRQAATRDIDNTGLTPLSWTSDSTWWVGDGATASIIRPVATDGTGFISFSGSPQSIQRCGFRNLKIDSTAAAGHIWSFAENGISFTRWENLWVIQRNPNKAILYGRFVGSGGMFENQWVGGVYEHGTGSGGTIVAATVPAFDIESDVNLITLNKWQDLRAHCHGSLAPFWRLAISDDAVGNKKYIHQNEWRGINVELPRRGIIQVLGGTETIVEDITIYDLGLNGASNNVDGHLFEFNLGPGGRHCQQTKVSKVVRNGAGTLVGVAGTAVSVASITRASTTATLTKVAHGYGVGQRIYVLGAAESEYNGRHTVTSVPTADTLTYEVSGTPATPATGTITVAEGAVDIKLSAINELDHIEDCVAVGGSDVMEIDVNGTSAHIEGHRPDLLMVVRGNNACAELEVGGEDTVSTLRIGEVSTDKLSPRTASCVNWGFDGDIEGLQLEWLTVNTLRIKPGRCRSDDDTDVIDSTENSPINVTTSGAAGIDTGSVQANTVYDVYLIWDSAGSANTVGIAVLSGNSPVMPAQRDKKRRVGSFSTNAASEVRDFTQYGAGKTREMWFNDTETNLRVLNGGSSTTLANASLSGFVPLTARVVTLATRFVGATAGNKLFLVPAHHAAADWGHLTCQVNGQEVRGQARMATSTALNVGYYVTNAADDAYLYLVAYEEYL